MSISLYDKSLLLKLNYWTKNTLVHVYDVDDSRTLYESIADMNGDKPLELPILSLSRKGGCLVINPNNRPLTDHGLTIVQTEDDGTKLNAIPIRIDYSLDVYTRYREEAEMYVRNLLFNIINYPKVEIIIPYRDLNYKHYASIRVLNDIQDDSSSVRLSYGLITKLSLPIYIDDAYMWDVREKDNVYLEDSSVSILNPDNTTWATEVIKLT